MPKVTVWVHPKREDYFTTKRKYKAALKREAKDNLAQRKRLKYVNGVKEFCGYIRTLETAQEICDFIMDNQRMFMINAVMNSSFDRGIKQALRDGKDVKFSPIERVALTASFNEHLSNSHSAPIGQRQNFGRKEGEPTGYPGFGGRWEVDFEHTDIFVDGKRTNVSAYYGSDIVTRLGINTGSGGGADRAKFGVSVFTDDFPFLGRIGQADHKREVRNAKARNKRLQIKQDAIDKKNTWLGTAGKPLIQNINIPKLPVRNDQIHGEAKLKRRKSLKNH